MRAIAVLLCCLPAIAQTFVVDAANGPGTNFTDLPPAIAAVPDGAILLVRPGTYGPIALNGKGLSILATGPGAVGLAAANTPISVLNLAATQSVTLRGIGVQDSLTFAVCLLRDCAGPVLIDGYTFTSAPTYNAIYSQGLQAERCQQLMLRNCAIQAYAALDLTDCEVAAEQCVLRGHTAYNVPHVGAYAGTGVTVTRGSLVLSRCQVAGGNGVALPTIFGTTLVPPGPAMHLWQTTVRLAEDATGSYVAGQLAGGAATNAIAGSQSTLLRSSLPTLLGSNGAPAVAGNVVDIVRELPSLSTVNGPPGGVTTAAIGAPLFDLMLLAVALPGVPTVVPGVDGAIWLDAASTSLAALGVPQPGMPFVHSQSVPNVPGLLGVRFSWQAVAWNAVDGLRASNPSSYAH